MTNQSSQNCSRLSSLAFTAFSVSLICHRFAAGAEDVASCALADTRELRVCARIATYELDRPCRSFALSVDATRVMVLPGVEFTICPVMKQWRHINVVSLHASQRISTGAPLKYCVHDISPSASHGLVALRMEKFTPNSRIDPDGVVEIHDVKANRILRSIHLSRGSPSCIALSHCGRLIAYSLDAELVIDDVAGSKEGFRRYFEEEVNSISFSPDGRCIAVSHGGGLIDLIEVASGQVIRNLSAGTEPLYSVVFLCGGRRIAACSRGEKYTAYTWNVLSARCTASLDNLHVRELAAIGTSGEAVALLCGDKKHVRIFDAALTREVATVDLDKQVERIAAAPGVNCVAACDSEGSIHVLRVPIYRSLPASSKPVVYSRRELEAAWSVLGSHNARDARAASSVLVSGSKKTVLLLTEKLTPHKAHPEEMDKCIEDLDDDRYRVRNRARRRLLFFADVGAEQIERALQDAPTPESRQSLRRVREASGAIVIHSPEVLRMLRALEVLERIDTQQSKRLIQSMGRGAGSSPVTREAIRVMGRWNSKGAVFHEADEEIDNSSRSRERLLDSLP